ncbi:MULTISPECIES: integrase [Ramlibacter]|uniref:Integrase n=1 Tax=Ramlibacter pinisoli TaxID=2682844 RepID=A0A6N8IVH7_9BURK|nr:MULTISPECIES: integrase [Ramlibacter]MBA2964988.1 integrase [Ramlibacter sp. CGMCC 1.13660]MVQ29953.1 integrase [Ramlibacter pinisoli]
MREDSVTDTVTANPRLLTAGQRIAALELGRSIVLEKIPMGGSLEARRLPAGTAQFYWRFTQAGKTTRVPIGAYDSGAPPKSLKPSGRGYSVAAAVEAARELAKLNAETPGGLVAKREREDQERRKQDELTRARATNTLRALCDEYVAWLAAQNKVSAAGAKNVFHNHLYTAHPGLASKAAVEVEKREIVVVLRTLVEAGKATTARKLRSYLRAAYACALKADSDARLPSGFIPFMVVSNPVEATAPIPSRAEKNPLPLIDLQRYWRELRKKEGSIGAALRLHVAMGGQRPAQLVRLRSADVSAFSVRLMDAKGRRAEPREHLLPKTDVIARELRQLPKDGFVLSTDGGTTPMHPTSLTAWAAEVARAAGLQGFQLKRVRSGIETALAEAGVSLHVRGLLQSHGIGGVQERHYDAHEYMAEKRDALDLLIRTLNRSIGARTSHPRVALKEVK